MKKFLKWMLRIVAVLILVLALAWGFENWRGARAWKKAQERAAAAGVSLDLADYVAPEIPDSENLLKNPEFLSEWNGENDPRLERWTRMELSDFKERGAQYGKESVALGRARDYRKLFEEELTEAEATARLSEVAREVEKRLDRLAEVILSYPMRNLSGRFVAEVPLRKHTSYVLKLYKLTAPFKDQAILALRKGEPERALRNIQVLEHMSHCFGRPTLVGFLVSNALRAVNDTIIWEGLRLRQWSDSELDQLAELVSSREIMDTLSKAYRYEIAHGLTSMKKSEEFSEQDKEIWMAFNGGDTESTLRNKLMWWMNFHGPSGWNGLRKAVLVDGYLDLLERKDRWGIEMLEAEKDQAERSLIHPTSVARKNVEGTKLAIKEALKYQTTNKIVRLAIALERSHARTGSYPKHYDELGLEFSPIDQTDPEARSLEYQLAQDGRPQIWSAHEEEEEPMRPRLRWQYWEASRDWRDE